MLSSLCHTFESFAVENISWLNPRHHPHSGREGRMPESCKI